MMTTAIKKDYETVNKFWQFYKRNMDVHDTDEYWTSVVREGMELEQECGSTVLAKELHHAFLTQLYELAKSADVPENDLDKVEVAKAS